MNKLKKFLAVLSAATMLIGGAAISGMTVSADEAQAAVTDENISYDGVFSEGARYHFISGSEALIIDGEGTFTAEEFSELANMLKPKAVALQNNVSVNDEWISDALSLSSPFVVYTHYYGKSMDDIKAFREKIIQEAKNKGADISKIASSLYHVNMLDYYLEDVDFYERFSYSPEIIERGQEMVKYLTDKGIREYIAQKTASCYLFGLQDRIYNRAHLDECPSETEIANLDGTEINDETLQYIRTNCYLLAETEQALIEKAEGKTGQNGTVEQFLADNGITVDISNDIQINYAAAKKINVAGLSFPLVRNPESVEFNAPDFSVIRETSDAVNTTAAVVVDINGDGTVGVADIVLLQKALSTSTATLDMDVNGDGKVNVFDVVALKRMLSDDK